MTKRGLLAHLLTMAGDRGITTGEILRAGVGSRYGARLLELRAAGWTIQTERVGEGSYRYTLLGVPDVDRGASTSSPSARGASVDTGQAMPLWEPTFDELVGPADPVDGIRGES